MDRFYTIMSKGCRFPDANAWEHDGQGIWYFSNPNVTFYDDNFGTVTPGNGTSDNAKMIRQNMVRPQDATTPLYHPWLNGRR